jgi:hypothetical protein
MPEREDDPQTWVLAKIVAMREGREPDSDHYAAALDILTQMRGHGLHLIEAAS